MDEVIELAEKLSRAIANSRRYLDLREAEKAVMSDPEAVAKIREREELREKLAEKERKVEPIEVAEKREMAALDEYVQTNPKIGALWKAQADFQEMWNVVNGKIGSALGAARAADEAPGGPEAEAAPEEGAPSEDSPTD